MCNVNNSAQCASCLVLKRLGQMTQKCPLAKEYSNREVIRRCK
jgi:hypothetical protein